MKQKAREKLTHLRQHYRKPDFYPNREHIHWLLQVTDQLDDDRDNAVEALKMIYGLCRAAMLPDELEPIWLTARKALERLGHDV